MVFVPEGSLAYFWERMQPGLTLVLILGVLTLAPVALLGLIGLEAFTTGALIDVCVLFALGLTVGLAVVRRRRNDVRWVEFLPADWPTELKVVRMVGSSRMPIEDLLTARVIDHIDGLYEQGSPRPEVSIGVEVQLDTTRGMVRSPYLMKTTLKAAGEELDELLPLGVIARRETQHHRNFPLIQAEYKSWWRTGQVAEAWGVPPDDARILLKRLRVRRAVAARISYGAAGPTAYDPDEVRMVAAQIADGTVARYAVAVLLEQLARVGMPGERVALPEAGDGDSLEIFEFGSLVRDLSNAGARCSLARALAWAPADLPGSRQLFFDSSLVSILGDEGLTARCRALHRLLLAWGRTQDTSRLPVEVESHLDHVRYLLCCAARREELPPHVPPPDSGHWTAPPGMPSADELAARVEQALADRPTVRLSRHVTA
ncbi:hypothetical protein GCM10009760_43300 [Kitasatospora kazusensis]|uniref:Type VII secretion protein EccE n=1 Tax=Kitasatospora kazusensis TaxID=407974 RepID=A0ABP5LLR8_9ACTN